jgi:hypothetical protein
VEFFVGSTVLDHNPVDQKALGPVHENTNGSRTDLGINEYQVESILRGLPIGRVVEAGSGKSIADKHDVFVTEFRSDFVAELDANKRCIVLFRPELQGCSASGDDAWSLQLVQPFCRRAACLRTYQHSTPTASTGGLPKKSPPGAELQLAAPLAIAHLGLVFAAGPCYKS